MEKQSSVFGLIHGVNNAVNMSGIGSAFMNADLAKSLFLHQNSAGKLVGRTHLFGQSSANPKIKVPNFVTRIGQGAEKQINKLGPDGQKKLYNINKRWNQAAMVQGGVMLADLGATVLENRAKPRPVELNDQVPGSFRPAGSKPLGNNNGALRPKSGSMIRPAHEAELLPLVRICLNHPDEFGLADEKSVELLIKNFVTQHTYIMGDLMNFYGFINGGPRGLPADPKAYYVRAVYVNPVHGGKGIAVEMINEIYARHGAGHDGLWMQIDSKNERMQRLAQKQGFAHIDNWVFGEKTSGIWLRRNV